MSLMKPLDRSNEGFLSKGVKDVIQALDVFQSSMMDGVPPGLDRASVVGEGK